jgi:hypothetical protein
MHSMKVETALAIAARDDAPEDVRLEAWQALIDNGLQRLPRDHRAYAADLIERGLCVRAIGAP